MPLISELIPLDEWFSELTDVAHPPGSLIGRCAETAKRLLAAPQETVVLHGDIHHGNVLDFGRRGWLAIDPKGLTGERGFDYANIFTNPDLAVPGAVIATDSARFRRRLAIVSQTANLDPQRLLMWITAWCGLSAVWSGEADNPDAVTMSVAQMAVCESDK